MNTLTQMMKAAAPMRGTINRTLLSCGIVPDKASMFAHMRQAFTFEESLRIAYVPVLLTKKAFRFAEGVCVQCAASKLPYQRYTRIIRAASDSYIRQTLGATISKSTLQILENRTDLLFDRAGDNVQTLWFVVNNELKKQHPELDHEYELLTNLFCAVSLLNYVEKYERVVDMTITQRNGLKNATTSVQEVTDVKNALLSIADKYKICHTSMINLSVRIIAIKIDTIVQELKEIYAKELEGGNV